MVVFKVLNKITGQHYVGSCRGDIYERWALYVRAAEAGLDYPLYHEIREQGESSFSITELDYADSIEELKEMELLHTIELLARSLRAYKFGVKDAVVKRCSKLDLDRAWMKDLQEEISQAHGDDEIPVPRTPVAGKPSVGIAAAKRPLLPSRSTLSSAKKPLTSNKKKPVPSARSVAKKDPAAALLAQVAAEKQALEAEQAAKKAAFPSRLAALSRAVKADSDWASVVKKQQASKTSKVSKVSKVSTASHSATLAVDPNELAAALTVTRTAPCVAPASVVPTTTPTPTPTTTTTTTPAEPSVIKRQVGDVVPAAACSDIRARPSGQLIQPGLVAEKGVAPMAGESLPSVSASEPAGSDAVKLAASVWALPEETAPATRSVPLRSSAAMRDDDQADEKAVLAEGIALLVRTLGSAEQMSRVQQEVHQQSQQMSQALAMSVESMAQLQQLQQQAALQSQKAFEAVAASLAANDALAQAQQQAQLSANSLMQSLQPADETATLVTQLQDELGALLAKLKRATPCAKSQSPAAEVEGGGPVAKQRPTTKVLALKEAVTPPSALAKSDPVAERPRDSMPELAKQPLLQDRESVIAAQEKTMVNRLQQLGTLISAQKRTDDRTDVNQDAVEPVVASASSEKTVLVTSDIGAARQGAKEDPQAVCDAPREPLPDLQARAWVAPAKGGGQGPRLLEKSTPVATIVRRRSRSPAPLQRRADRTRPPAAGSGFSVAASSPSGSASAKGAAAAKMADRPVLSRKTLGLKNR